jgi:PhnB protein
MTKGAKLMAVKPIPDGYHAVTPYLVVDGASKLIDFLKGTFGATELFRMPAPGDRVGHAEVKIGDSNIMIADNTGEWPARPAMLYVYVTDVDATHKRALSAGATQVKEPANQFYGDRSSGITDAFGNYWGIATHVEDVSPEELERRAKQAHA